MAISRPDMSSFISHVLGKRSVLPPDNEYYSNSRYEVALQQLQSMLSTSPTEPGRYFLAKKEACAMVSVIAGNLSQTKIDKSANSEDECHLLQFLTTCYAVTGDVEVCSLEYVHPRTWSDISLAWMNLNCALTYISCTVAMLTSETELHIVKAKFLLTGITWMQTRVQSYQPVSQKMLVAKYELLTLRQSMSDPDGAVCFEDWMTFARDCIEQGYYANGVKAFEKIIKHVRVDSVDVGRCGNEKHIRGEKWAAEAEYEKLLAMRLGKYQAVQVHALELLLNKENIAYEACSRKRPSSNSDATATDMYLVGIKRRNLHKLKQSQKTQSNDL